MCLCGRDVRLQLWGRAVGACRDAGKQSDCRRAACGGNYGPFGMCSNPANPQVAAATAAALGVLTPMPCVPVVSAPWAPGSPAVLVANKPALNQNSKAMCAWGGMIQITNPGNSKVMIP